MSHQFWTLINAEDLGWSKTTLASVQSKKLTNPGNPAAHPEPAYRCFLPDLTGFTGPWSRRTRAYERSFESIELWSLLSLKSLNFHSLDSQLLRLQTILYGGEGGI